MPRNLHYAAAPSGRCKSLPKVRHAARQCDKTQSIDMSQVFGMCQWHPLMSQVFGMCHWKPEVSRSIVACANGVCASDVMSRNVKTASAPSVIVDVRRSLLQVEPCKAAGPDNIPGRVLKDCISYLRYYLKFLTSHSFKQRYHHVLNLPPLSPFQRLQQFRAWMTIVQ